MILMILKKLKEYAFLFLICFNKNVCRTNFYDTFFKDGIKINDNFINLVFNKKFSSKKEADFNYELRTTFELLSQ